MRSQVPQDQMIVCAIGRQLVAFGHQGLSQSRGIRLYVLGILDKVWGVYLQELTSESTDLVIVRSALQGREHSHVNAILDIWNLVRVLVEDHSSTRTPQRLVGCRCYHIAMLEWGKVLSSRHQARDVSNVSHQQCTAFICNCAKFRKVKSARICGEASNNHLWTEDQCILAEFIEVDESGLGVHFVREGLEVHGSCRDLLFGSIITMSQMSSTRQVQTHYARMRFQERGVDCKVGRAARVRLDIHSPLLITDTKGSKRTGLAKILDLVDDLVAAIVARTRLAF